MFYDLLEFLPQIKNKKFVESCDIYNTVPSQKYLNFTNLQTEKLSLIGRRLGQIK